jgi:Lon protease-like protein
MLEGSLHPESLNAIPLFPLPNVVLFPRAVLPLHIFEERYKEMTADVIQGDRRIAMALLKPGWEKNYYQTPALEPVVCVGTILSHERLDDGKYNFLLQGNLRARIIKEHYGLPYRTADLAPLEEIPVMEIDLSPDRDRMKQLFAEGIFPGAAAWHFSQLLAGPLTTSDIADVAAFSFLEDANVKQSLLSDTDVRRRVSRTLAALEDARSMLQMLAMRSSSPPGMN